MEKGTKWMLVVSLVLLLSFTCFILIFGINANAYLQFYFGETHSGLGTNGSKIVSAPIKGDSPVYTSGENYYVERINGSMKIVATCSEWSYCENNIEKRDCIFLDVSKQLLEIVDQTRACSTCKEKWQCSFSNCVDGFIESNCEDLNKCGTKRDSISKIPCSLGVSSQENFYDGFAEKLFSQEVVAREERLEQNCTSNLKCDLWSSCELNYNFNSFTVSTDNLKGFQSRYCYDSNNCVGSFNEKRDCFLSLDILVKNETICGQDYINFYDKRTNKSLSLMKLGSESNPSTSINLLSETSSLKCPSCTNHIRDGGELMVDCGGSCGECIFQKRELPSDYLLFASNYAYILLGISVILFAILIFIFMHLPKEESSFIGFSSGSPFVAEI